MKSKIGTTPVSIRKQKLKCYLLNKYLNSKLLKLNKYIAIQPDYHAMQQKPLPTTILFKANQSQLTYLGAKIWVKIPDKIKKLFYHSVF